MEPAFFEGRGGLRIASWVLAASDPGLPTLLVAHATGFHTRCYRAMAESLADRFRVVGFDLRGHGHSATPPLDTGTDGGVPTMDWRCFAEDALDVVDALELDRPVAFGHSCGGAVLLQAEELRPGSFGAVYAYEPIVAPPEVWERMGEEGNPSSAARRRRPDFASRAAALEHLSTRSALSSMRGDILVDYVEGGFADGADGTVHLRCSPEAEAATYAMAPHADTWERLAEVRCPVTVACGGAGGFFGRDLAAAVADRLPHGHLEEHPDLGHLGPFEQPEAVAEAVATALAD